MGYTTEFRGSFRLSSPLSLVQRQFLSKFAYTRRMKRDAERTAKRDDPVREAVGLPVGEEGAYFVGEEGFMGQVWGDRGALGIVCYNTPPAGQPSLWCQWVPTEDGSGIEWEEDGSGIEWDGGEKFYYYVEWIEYTIKHFLGPWGLVLDGHVSWQGEDESDIGIIIVEDNVVRVEESTEMGETK